MTNPDGQVAAAGDPAILVPPPAAVPAAVTQRTSVPCPGSTTGTGELAQLPPMLVHGVQRVLWFGRRCLVTPTEPSASDSKTSTSPRGSRTAAGSVVRSGGRGEAASGVPHSQSFGKPACCQPCSTRPARSRANTVSFPSACATADGLDTIVVGDFPTVGTADQVRLPTGCCQACESAWPAERANHSAVPLLLIATATR